MLNPHLNPVDPAGQQPPMVRVVQDQVNIAVASTVRISQNPPTTTPSTESRSLGQSIGVAAEPGPPVTSPISPLVSAAGPARGGIDHAAAWLMFGLTVACFVFLAYLVTIDKADLQVGIPATMGVVLTLNTAVFGTRTVMHKTRKAAAVAGHAVADMLDPVTGSDQ